LRFALPLDLAGPRRAALGSRSAWFGHGIDVDPLQNPVSLLQWQLEHHTVFATERSDERSNGHGWVHLADAHSGITLKLRRPWQNYPTACSAQASEIAIDLYPDLRQFAPPEREGGANWTQLNRPQGPDFKGPLHIPQGMAKTHEIFVHCGAPLPDARQVDQLCLAFEQPLMPVLEGEHYASSNALGPFQPYRDAYWPLELELRRFCTTPNGTGIINSGDVVKLAQLDDQMHTQTCENLAYDLPRSLLRQFLRTGDAALFWEGEAAVMHLMDIDTVHYSAEHPEWVGGPYVEWSQNHHYADSDEAALSGPKTSHAWLGSLLDYYFLTGYERAREIAEACADFCRRNAPYRWKQELSADKRLRALDPDEDWPFSTRVAGWPLVAMSTYYEAFRDERFLRSMEALVDLFAVWQDEEGRWREQIGSFNRGATPFMNASVLQGLMRYHQCTGDGRALQMQLKGARFLAAQGRSLEGIFYYKESALSATPHASTAMLLEPLAFAYEQSGEHQLLDAGYRLFRWLIDSGSVSTYMLKDLFAFMPLLERLGLLENYRGICIDEELIKGSRPRGA
jgi:hypothetical protein